MIDVPQKISAFLLQEGNKNEGEIEVFFSSIVGELSKCISMPEAEFRSHLRSLQCCIIHHAISAKLPDWYLSHCFGNLLIQNRKEIEEILPIALVALQALKNSGRSQLVEEYVSAIKNCIQCPTSDDIIDGYLERINSLVSN